MFVSIEVSLTGKSSFDFYNPFNPASLTSTYQ
jgi:hypothetical protein